MRRSDDLIALGILEHFPGGISVIDGDLRVIFSNHKMRQLLDLPDSLFADGPPLFEEIARFNARRGDYGPGDVEQQVAERIALAKAHTPHEFDRTRPDGTVSRYAERRSTGAASLQHMWISPSRGAPRRPLPKR
jgi:PAS domain-containing protein